MGCLNIVKIPCFDPFKGHRKLQWIYQKLSNPIVKWGSVFTCAYIFTHTLIFIWMVEYKILILFCENKKNTYRTGIPSSFWFNFWIMGPYMLLWLKSETSTNISNSSKILFQLTHITCFILQRRETPPHPYWSRRGLN